MRGLGLRMRILSKAVASLCLRILLLLYHTVLNEALRFEGSHYPFYCIGVDEGSDAIDMSTCRGKSFEKRDISTMVITRGKDSRGSADNGRILGFLNEDPRGEICVADYEIDEAAGFPAVPFGAIMVLTDLEQEPRLAEMADNGIELYAPSNCARGLALKYSRAALTNVATLAEAILRAW